MPQQNDITQSHTDIAKVWSFSCKNIQTLEHINIYKLIWKSTLR